VQIPVYANMDTFVGGCRWLRWSHATLVAGLVLALTASTVSQSRTAAPPSIKTLALATDEDITSLLLDRIDRQRKSVGIVVGIITPANRRVISVGHTGGDSARPLNGDTVFRIASVTKVFTALLLTDMIRRRELALTDPVATHLPTGVTIPQRNGRSITLLDLATHTSGLPPAPRDFPPLTDPAAATYSVQQVYQFLSTYELPRDIGSQWEYGNLDMALLGHALAQRAGTDYESLIRARISAPLGLTGTAVTLSSAMRDRQAVGHDTQLQPITRAEAPAMAPAGSLWSTANDLVKFLGAAIGLDESALAPAMAAMLGVRRPMPWLGSRDIAVTAEQGLGWFIFNRERDIIIEHDGGTPGYSAAVAYDPQLRVGVVVLSNASPLVGDLARHLIRPDLFPLDRTDPPLTRPASAIDASRLDGHVGRYQFAPVETADVSQAGGTIDVSREGDVLIFNQAGGARAVLRPANEREFFASEIDLRVTFQVDDQGRTIGLLVHRFGRDSSARRVDTGLRNR
jgi:D-alanyl-D-alanine-carboxypeptidase/D-alanyl-D-alanine-endopeptidase